MENCGLAVVLCLIYFIFDVGCVQVDLQTGTNYTFLSNAKGKIASIEWRHNSDLVYEYDPPHPEPVWYRYQKRASIDKDTGNFLLQVTKEDNGIFLGKFQVNEVIHMAEYKVNVFDPVPKPKVTCKKINSTNITLMCLVDTSVQADFLWTGPNEFSQSGKSIHITRTASENLVYYCTVSNKVSRNATEFNLSDCDKDEPDDGGSNVGAVVGGLFVVGAIIAVLAGVAFWCKKKREDSAKRGSSGGKTDETTELKKEENNSHLGQQDPALVTKEDDATEK